MPVGTVEKPSQALKFFSFLLKLALRLSRLVVKNNSEESENEISEDKDRLEKGENKTKVEIR